MSARSRRWKVACEAEKLLFWVQPYRLYSESSAGATYDCREQVTGFATWSMGLIRPGCPAGHLPSPSVRGCRMPPKHQLDEACEPWVPRRSQREPTRRRSLRHLRLLGPHHHRFDKLPCRAPFAHVRSVIQPHHLSTVKGPRSCAGSAATEVFPADHRDARSYASTEAR